MGRHRKGHRISQPKPPSPAEQFADWMREAVKLNDRSR